jgi:hypothetical protein
MKRRREDGEKWLPPSDPQLKIEGNPKLWHFFKGKMMENDDQSVDLGKKNWVAIPYVTISVCPVVHPHCAIYVHHVFCAFVYLFI